MADLDFVPFSRSTAAPARDRAKSASRFRVSSFIGQHTNRRQVVKQEKRRKSGQLSSRAMPG
jgi:hypothetical protein